MEPKHGIGLFLAVGLAGVASRWARYEGIRALEIAWSIPWWLFLSGAIAIVTLAPAALDTGRSWLWKTAALIPGAILGFVAEQLEEALVPGGAGAALTDNLVLGAFAVTATAWLVWRAERHHRRWIAYGLGVGAVLAVLSLSGIGVAMLAAQLLTLTVFVGLVVEWVRGRRPRPADDLDASTA